MSDMIYI